MDTLSKPLGTDLPYNPYREPRELIGEVLPTAAGNTSLRIGRMVEDGSSWQQIAFITLTPIEREELIRVLEGHRQPAPEVEMQEVVAEPTEWQLEQITCTACGTDMTRLALYGHECPELRASRDRGRRILAAMRELGPDDESERFDG